MHLVSMIGSTNIYDHHIYENVSIYGQAQIWAFDRKPWSEHTCIYSSGLFGLNFQRRVDNTKSSSKKYFILKERGYKVIQRASP